MSREDVEVVRKPLRVRPRPGRTLDQRLGIRFPRLVAPYVRLIGRLPPGSRLRQAVTWRGSQHGMEAFNRRDLHAAVIAGHPDFETHPPREFVEAGFFEPCYRGLQGFREYLSTWSDVLGEFRVEPRELIDLGDRIVMLADLRARAQASGLPVRGMLATVSVMKEGKAIRVEVYLDHAEALEAVGLSE